MDPEQFRDRLPFVGCFKAADKHYIYDVNSNEILRVPPDLFGRMVRALNTPSVANHYLNHPDIHALQNLGYLSPHRPRAVSGPCRKHLEASLGSKIEHCVLELTQACNQRCVYCPYSPLDTSRDNTPERT
jgi:uncharacterized protein